MLINSNGEELGEIGGGGGISFDENGRKSTSSDDDDEDDDDNDEGKILAARTLAAVRWLHAQGKLTANEKRVLTSDIVKNVGGGKFSQAEVAYSILVGDGRPGEWDSDVVMDMAVVDKDDVIEFAEACRSLAKRLSGAV